MEAAESQARSIESNSRSGNVNSLEQGHFDSPKRGGGRCYWRGLEGHFARDPECRARLATCMKCKKVGHFAKVCKTKEEDTIRPRKRNIHQVTMDDDFAFTLQSFGKDCRNRSHCFITKLISDIGHCVLFDIFLFNRFDHARFFWNNILISMFFDGAN